MIMKHFIAILSFVLFIFQSLPSKCDEGMWIPLLLKEQNIEKMQKMGLKLSAEDIYSINKSSLKDAIVIFGGGCTGELISDQGLLITNHHCGFRNIQSHSSVENDYLSNGFWAMRKDEELPNPGLKVRFLVRMENVTQQVLEGVTKDMNENQRHTLIESNIDKIEKIAKEDNNYEAYIEPFFYGNEYYLFVNQVFKDVRLVGAPPSSIGKFGGDTDNWMWPRHTGDFSLFRIYADKNNNPAEYSKDNVPYKPKKHLTISTKGVKEGDFTFVFGYPGSTTQFITSHEVDLIQNKINPANIESRRAILDVYESFMNQDDKVRIQYAAKHASIANAWKKWIGENRGLIRLDAIAKKQALENQFIQNVDSEYKDLISEFKNTYNSYAKYLIASETFFETFYKVELVGLVRSFNSFYETVSSNPDDLDEINSHKERLKSRISSFFKDYYMPIDKKITSIMLEKYRKNTNEEFHPTIYKTLTDEYKNNYEGFSEYLFNQSMFDEEEKMIQFVENFTIADTSVILKDVFYKLVKQYIVTYQNHIVKPMNIYSSRLDSLYRLYVGQMLKDKSKILYPDANSTLRITYGKVSTYEPSDAVTYHYYTTLDGVIEKSKYKEIGDYQIPGKLKQLYEKKDFGDYAENGKIHIAFTATNHTTGGNSGSPVLNAYGELIGVNFDRNWEGTMSDIMYDPSKCRNISLDIRYVLFIIDKYAGAKHLIDEMSIAKAG